MKTVKSIFFEEGMLAPTFELYDRTLMRPYVINGRLEWKSELQFAKIKLAEQAERVRRKKLPWWKKIFSVLALVALLVSCGNEPKFIPESIEPYVNEFRTEASARHVELKWRKLKFVVAGILPENQYQAYYNPNTDVIYIRTDCFNHDIQAIVSHELGHALLKRVHDFGKLYDSNGDPVASKSVMGSTAISDYNGWQNDHSYRKGYYYDELFNSNTPSPNWTIASN